MMPPRNKLWTLLVNKLLS
uniref:Uncharacterized protein n=1 Tax=Arundo donax TaxID=35708 RepID=A0A0A9HAE3_ARUDO